MIDQQNIVVGQRSASNLQSQDRDELVAHCQNKYYYEKSYMEIIM